jgi:hypothetical protein
MAEETARRKAKPGLTGETGAPPTIEGAITQIPAEIRDQLTSLMQELLLKTHELSFEYSTMDSDHIATCPLAKKSTELFRVVKKLNETVRQMAPQKPPTYLK